MLRTPLKNSKNVDKPFKSPFESPGPSKEIKKPGPSCFIDQSPLASKKFVYIRQKQRVFYCKQYDS